MLALVFKLLSLGCNLLGFIEQAEAFWEKHEEIVAEQAKRKEAANAAKTSNYFHSLPDGVLDDILQSPKSNTTGNNDETSSGSK